MSASEIEKNLALLEHEDETMWTQMIEEFCTTSEQYEEVFKDFHLTMNINKAIPILTKSMGCLLCWAMAKLVTEAVRRGIVPQQDPNIHIHEKG